MGAKDPFSKGKQPLFLNKVLNINLSVMKVENMETIIRSLEWKRHTLYKEKRRSSLKIIFILTDN